MSDQAPEATPEAPADTGGSNDALMSRMDELAQSIQALAPKPDERPLHQQMQADPEPQYEEPDYGEFEDPYQQAPQFDPNAIQQMIQQGIQQAVGPMQASQRAEAYQRHAEGLEQKYPDLAKPEIAGPIVAEAQQFGLQNLDPRQGAALIEKLYLAQRVQSQAAQETPADGQSNVRLEGASAQVAAPEGDVFDQMVQAGPGQSGFKWT